MTKPATRTFILDILFRGEMHTVGIEVPFAARELGIHWPGAQWDLCEEAIKAAGLPGRLTGFKLV